MAKISVALTTFNEEENIQACLESVKGLAEEVVVVDGSSTDKTRELAKKAGAKVVKTTNKPMFHLNKNLAIENCTGDWVLMLDADERVSPKLASEMKEIAEQKWDETQPAGYWMARKNFFLTRYLTKGGQYPDPVIRFFKREKGTHPCQSVHEQIKIEGIVGWLKNDLLHEASPSFTRYLTRENRYSTLEAHKLVQRGLKPNLWLAFRYLCWLPKKTFLTIFIRHKGFMDGFPGFVFALFSGFHFLWAYVKFWELSRGSKRDLKKDWV